MKLVEALKIVRAEGGVGGKPFSVALVCGCMGGHLQTFLAAHLRVLDPGRAVDVRTGLYGDCLGNLERLRAEPADAGALVLEWPDLDPRLGLRALGGWRPSDLPDILATARARLARFRDVIEAVAGLVPMAVCPPTLPLPPLSYTPGWQAGPFDVDLAAALGEFTARVAGLPGVRVASRQRLDLVSPPHERLDVRSELMAGFPYKVAHASALGGAMARLVRPPQPKKGLITDLDDTVWRGLVGEVGAAGVSWHLDQHSHAHGIYQQVLASLAAAGTLVAAASKNDPAAVEEAFAREDLILAAPGVFPREVHWNPKSESVGRILRAWNVGADSVVFVDDSPMELAEVKAAFPEIECLLFPTRDEGGVYDLTVRLRDLFGKGSVSREDAIRLESLRRAAGRDADGEGPGGADPDRFLEQAGAALTLNFSKAHADPRALELVNKTNQFNLNGRRYTDGEWAARLRDPATFLLRVAYEDKFGPLGTIAVVSGRAGGPEVVIDTWVMSCRAFSRRIEHRCLAAVFEGFGAGAVVLDYQATPRNGPLLEFLSAFMNPGHDRRLAGEDFERQCPPLFHRVKKVTDE